MNKKINLFGLINTISSQTKLDPDLVEKFVVQFFKEIEKELTTSPSVKIDGLGMFRIIKSLPADRILFLGDFENDKKVIINTEDEFDDTSGIIDQHESEISEFDDTSTLNNEKEYLDSVEINSQTENNNYNVEKEIQEDQDSLSEYLSYEEEEIKKNRFTKIRIAILIILTIVGVLALLVFLYPKDVKDNLSAPSITAPTYVLVQNHDTINYVNIVEAKSELDFVTLSQDFYGYGKFWPYIYKANEETAPDPLEIKIGAIIKVPRLDSILIDRTNKESLKKAEIMASEIIKLRN